METIFMSTENSKTNEPDKFVLNLSQRLDLRSSKVEMIKYCWQLIFLRINQIN